MKQQDLSYDSSRLIDAKENLQRVRNTAGGLY